MTGEYNKRRAAMVDTGWSSTLGIVGIVIGVALLSLLALDIQGRRNFPIDYLGSLTTNPLANPRNELQIIDMCQTSAAMKLSVAALVGSSVLAGGLWSLVISVRTRKTFLLLLLTCLLIASTPFFLVKQNRTGCRVLSGTIDVGAPLSEDSILSITNALKPTIALQTLPENIKAKLALPQDTQIGTDFFCAYVGRGCNYYFGVTFDPRLSRDQADTLAFFYWEYVKQLVALSMEHKPEALARKQYIGFWNESLREEWSKSMARTVLKPSLSGSTSP